MSHLLDVNFLLACAWSRHADHVLAGLVTKDKLAPEVTAYLGAILAVAKKARPNGE